MTVSYAPLKSWPQFQSLQWLRNSSSCFPDAQVQTHLLLGTNHILRWRTKEVFRGAWPIASVPLSLLASRNRWRFAFHSSTHARYLRVRFVLAKCKTIFGAVALDPYAKLLIQTGAGATVGTAEFHFGLNGSAGADVLSDFGIADVTLQSGGANVEIPANTALYGTFTDEGGSRIISACVYEVAYPATTDDDYMEPGVVAGGPILDTHRGLMTAALRSAWKYNGAHLFNWSTSEDASAPSRTSTTAINVINSASAVSTATPGFKLDLTNRSTIRRTSGGTAYVPVMMRSYAKMSSGGGSGTIRLLNSAGGDPGVAGISAVNVVTSATAGWVERAFNLPATNAKYDLFIEGDAVRALTLYATSLFQYEA